MVSTALLKGRFAGLLTAGAVLFTTMFSQPALAADKATSRDVYVAMQKAVKYYVKSDNNYSFDANFDWELIGLAHAGEKLDSRKWQDKNANTAFDYWAGAAKNLNEAGQLAKLAIGLMKNGIDPTNFNGKNLLKAIADRQDNNGRMGDDQWTIFNHVLAIVALEMYGFEDYDREEAAEFLLERYDDFAYDDSNYTDDWPFALHALRFLEDIDNVEEEMDKIVEKIDEQRKSNGSVADNPDSTMEALAALSSVGEDVLDGNWNKSVAYVLDNQLSDGSFQSAWSNGDTSEYTTQKGLYTLAVIKEGDALFERLTDKEKSKLKVYLPKEIQSDAVTVYDGMTNLIRGKEVKPSNSTYTVTSKQLFVRTDLQELELDVDKPLAVLVKVMKGKKVVDTAIVEADTSILSHATAGFTLSRGSYTVEINYWYGLKNNPEVASDSVIFPVTVK